MIDVPRISMTAATGRPRIGVVPTGVLARELAAVGMRPGRRADRPPSRRRRARTTTTRVASATMGWMRTPRGTGPRTAGGGDYGGSEPLRIGLLSALTGPLAPVERSIHDAALLAVDEVNAGGGVAGRRLEAVSADYASDTTRATFEATRLLREAGIRLLAGGYTSASRVAIQPALHKHDGLLLYPTYYEGLESDPRTLYAGAGTKPVPDARSWNGCWSTWATGSRSSARTTSIPGPLARSLRGWSPTAAGRSCRTVTSRSASPISAK